MYKFNDKLYLISEDGATVTPVTIVGKKPVTATAKKAFVETVEGKRFWVQLEQLIEIQSWLNRQAAETITPEVAPQTPKLKSYLPIDFLDAVMLAESAEQIKELCDKITEHLFGDRDYKLTTRVQKLSPYSKLFKNLDGLTEGVNAYYQIRQDGSQWLRHLYYKFTGLADIDWDAINKVAATKVIDKLENQALGLDPDQYEECVKRLIISQNTWELGAGLIAASGRRPIEIMHDGTGEFEVKSNSLVVLAQAKKRGEEFEPYEIPLIGVSPEFFMGKLAKFRDSAEVKKATARFDAGEIDLAGLSDQIRVEINRRGVVPILGWLPAIKDKQAPTCSDLRAAWLVVAEAKFKEDTKYSLLFRSQVLGHHLDVGSLATFNYSKYSVAPASVIPEPAIAEQIENLPVEPLQDVFTQENSIETEIKAISLHQPWASLIANKNKKYETRSWPTNYRGPIAIHAAKKNVDCKVAKLLGTSEIPLGAVVAIADLVDCIQMSADFIASQSELELSVGDWSVGRWAWRLENIRAIEPIPVSGKQGLWNWYTNLAIFPEKCPIEKSVCTPDEVFSSLPTLEADVKSRSLPDIIPVSASGRHEFDFYETPVWMTLLILKYVKLSGTIGECCAGYGAIADLLKMAGHKVWTNDVDARKAADYHIDATKFADWDTLPSADWIVTNPPFGDLAAPIVAAAYAKAKLGIVMLLPMNFEEGCEDRIDFLQEHPPTQRIAVPRYCFRKGKLAEWATDSKPVFVYIWEKKKASKSTTSTWLKQQDISLFYRNPDQVPSIEIISAEVKKFDITEKYNTKKFDKISAKVESFIEQNQQRPRSEQWLITVRVIRKIANCRVDVASDWCNYHQARLAVLNEGFNHTQNRNRNFKELDKFK